VIGSSINRLNVVIPPTAAVSDRDETISKIALALGNPPADSWRYVDSSPLGMWGYLWVTYVYNASGIFTVATVSCSGVAHPNSGSNTVPVADPGPGTAYTWTTVGAFPSIMTSGMGGGSPPAGNNNYYVWNIPGNSPSAASDFTAADEAIGAALGSQIISGVVVRRYYLYIDSVSGAWQFSGVYFGAGSLGFGSSSAANILAANNIMYVITCSGTPHPPTGSLAPATILPTFTQTPYRTLGGPLNFGPMR